tara:strand:- start:1679 stop:2305 length:627 start_codon:yes stop_codon:yes gene_type:complete
MIKNILITIIIGLASLSTKAGSHEPVIADSDDIEVIYFFSLKCPGCAAVRSYVNVWEKLNVEKDTKVNFFRVPVINNNKNGWSESAQLYFLGMHVAKELNLPKDKMEVLLFQAAMQDDPINHYDLRLKLLALDISVPDQLWRNAVVTSKKMMLLSRDVQSNLTVKKTPSFVITGHGERYSVELDSSSNNAALDLVTQLSKSVVKVIKP